VSQDPLDRFESQHMIDGERLIHRDKKVSRGLTAILGMAGLFTVIPLGAMKDLLSHRAREGHA
jgi:hypothetical protein